MSLRYPEIAAGVLAFPASTINRSNPLEHSAILSPSVRGKPGTRERLLAEYAGDTHLIVVAGSGANPSTSFWQDALAALPPAIRWRYAAFFEAAERWERNLDFMIDLWGRAKRAFARSFARGLRRSAGILELAARRLATTR